MKSIILLYLHSDLKNMFNADRLTENEQTQFVNLLEKGCDISGKK